MFGEPEYRRGPYSHQATDSTLPTFGARVRARRRALDITQAELGERLGRSQALVANWERGSREPRIDDLRKLATCLQISLDSLVLGGRFDILRANEIGPATLATSGATAQECGPDAG